MAVNTLAAKLAHSQGKTVILDCGGQDVPVSDEMLSYVTYVAPNEVELLEIDPTLDLKLGAYGLEEAVR